MNTKLKAFTLLELLIGMIISSIVIAVGYSTYSIVYKQFLLYKSMKSHTVEITQFNSVLNADIYNANAIKYNENQLIVERENKLELEYKFNADYILRKDDEVIDTFRVETKNIKANYLNENDVNSMAFIDKISFDVKIVDQDVRFVFNKMYSSEILVNKELQDQLKN